jgi:hypothetical protein
VNNIAISSNFIKLPLQTKKSQQLFLHYSQTSCHLESKAEIVLDICHFNLAPNMTIILFIHSLHLTKMAIWIIKGKLKKNNTIKCGWNATNFSTRNVSQFNSFNFEVACGPSIIA